ncbi:MAG: hypothetical protein FI698_04660 [SAR202 cluster bacterium]|nr:hypothetical protein [SAR202 cluster bacterium]|tara:strand:- start:233 stop:475 length:243 start_codon:yes stop_codon:yes gene_type:complete
MDKSNKTQINLAKRKFLKQIPILVVGGIAASTFGQNIFNSLFNKKEPELALNDEFFMARDHKKYGSCGCANCMYEKNVVI